MARSACSRPGSSQRAHSCARGRTTSRQLSTAPVSRSIRPEQLTSPRAASPPYMYVRGSTAGTQARQWRGLQLGPQLWPGRGSLDTRICSNCLKLESVVYQGLHRTAVRVSVPAEVPAVRPGLGAHLWMLTVTCGSSRGCQRRQRAPGSAGWAPGRTQGVLVRSTAARSCASQVHWGLPAGGGGLTTAAAQRIAAAGGARLGCSPRRPTARCCGWAPRWSCGSAAQQHDREDPVAAEGSQHQARRQASMRT